MNQLSWFFLLVGSLIDGVILIYLIDIVNRNEIYDPNNIIVRN